MESGTNFVEAFTESRSGEEESPRARVLGDEQDAPSGTLRSHELDMWLRALRSFFDTRNHPLTEAERTEILTRDFSNETRIALGVLLRSSQLIAGLTGESAGPLGEADGDGVSSLTEPGGAIFPDVTDNSLVELAEAVGDAYTVGCALCELRSLNFKAWASFGRILEHELTRGAGASERLAHSSSAARHTAPAWVQPSLLTLTESLTPDALAADMVVIFSDLARLLERLRFIEALLRRDYPLKQTLPIFTLVHEEARTLLDLIETRTLRIEGLDRNTFDMVDATSYAISMELRKTFEHELVGISALRQAPAVYAKVENAHGLLRDCFQQSTVALAQIFDPTLDGTRLFDAFQTKLDQSIALRQNLWTLLQLMRRAEKERDRMPVAPLIERIIMFRDGSLRYLMYKDWESYERFVEEIGAARGAVELAPVLHRFGAYLETLFGQINMRAVLSEHPFDYPATEDES